MKQLLIHLPEELKAKLDAKRAEGYTLNGYVRAVLERALTDPPKTRTARRKEAKR